ncbi:hypothetical protein FB451DRAFT_1440748 [Mycena latifolia]|nr:hypothetical protein FB451DRAFT_1440748 [Mycena latifolia]
MSEPPVYIRRRVYIACLNCRKRKIKCMTEEIDQKPCVRCRRHGLACEYLPVADEPIQSGTPKARKLDDGRRVAEQQAVVRPLIAFNPYPNYKSDSEQNDIHPNCRSTTSQMPGPTAASSSGSHSESIPHHRSQGTPPSSSSGLSPALPYGYSCGPRLANTHRTMHLMPSLQHNVAHKYPGPNNNFGYHLNDWEASKRHPFNLLPVTPEHIQRKCTQLVASRDSLERKDSPMEFVAPSEDSTILLCITTELIMSWTISADALVLLGEIVPAGSEIDTNA